MRYVDQGKLTWHTHSARWCKRYKGKTYYLTSGRENTQLGRRKAWEEWLARKFEVDNGLEQPNVVPRPLPRSVVLARRAALLELLGVAKGRHGDAWVWAASRLEKLLAKQKD